MNGCAGACGRPTNSYSTIIVIDASIDRQITAPNEEPMLKRKRHIALA